MRGRRRRWPAPPSGVAWRDAAYAVVDLELTGLDLKRDEIISAGVVPVRGGRITPGRCYWTVRPERAMDPEAVKVHALTVDELEASPPLSEVLGPLREALLGSVLVAHAAWVERAFLDRALAPLGERVPQAILDTAALARALGLRPSGPAVPSLEALAREVGVPVHTPHHSLGDAFTTAQVFLVLATRLDAERGGRLCVDDLVRLTRQHS